MPELPEGWHWKVEEPDHVEAVYMGTGLSVAIHDGDLSVFDFYNNGDVAGLGAVLPVIARFQALQGGAGENRTHSYGATQVAPRPRSHGR